MSTVSLDWGDGTIEQVEVSGNASSWSFGPRQHVYASPGSKTVTLDGLSGGTDSKSGAVAAQPTVVGTPTTGTTGTTAGSSVTVARPAGTQNGETLVACLRGQVASAVEFSCNGWRRLTPDYDATTSAGPRVTVIMVKPVVDIAAEPANYVFDRSTVERKDAVVFRVSGAGPAQPSGRAPTFGGQGVQASGGVRYTGSYAIETEPSLSIFAAGAEHSASASDVATVTPANISGPLAFVTSDPSISVSRTSLWVGVSDQPTGPVPQQDYAIASTSSGLAAVALRSTSPRHLFSSVTEMLAKPGWTMAHRGNSTIYAEGSLNAYLNAAARGYSVLECSLARTSDGVWIVLHDADLNRTSGLAPGTLPDVSTMTWAQVQTYNNVLALDGVARPYLRWEQFRDAFPQHILMLDPKNTWQGGAGVRAEFWDLAAQVGTSRAIVKGFVQSSSLPTEATNRGYQCWGYGYTSDIGNGNFTTYQSYWTMLGLEIAASQGDWDTVKGYGKPVVAHIALSVADYKTALTKAGASAGVQVGASATVPAVNAET